MEQPPNPHNFDPEQAAADIIKFIQDRFQIMNRNKIIIGLSGGLDSSLTATLAAKAIGADRVKLFYLPDRDSKPLHRKHARMLSNLISVDLKIIRITPALRILRIYSLLPLKYIPGKRLKSFAVNYVRRKQLGLTGGSVLNARLTGSGGPMVSRANAYINAKHRVRTVILFREAEKMNGVVLGAANRTEWLTGTFVKFGVDHNADVMPLLHIYRSQVEELARFLDLPREILEKESDTDILPGLEDKGSMMGSFQIADQILFGIENGIPLSELSTRFGQDSVAYLNSLVQDSASYREVPYTLL